jgi:ABC-2 type transport system permease protein
VTSTEAGKVHDLGYRRYAGSRRTGFQLWKVIARRGLRQTLRQPLVIIDLVLAALPLVLAGGYFYFSTKLGQVAAREIVRPGTVYVWVARANQELGFFLALIVGSSLLTDDVRAGGFAFYFSRPVTREAYLLGKLAPLAIAIGLVVILPPLVLSLEQVAVAGDARLLLVTARALAQGIVTTCALAGPAALISALVRRRMAGVGIFFGLMAGSFVIAKILASALGEKWPNLISLGKNMEIVAQWLYQEPTDASPLAAITILVAVIAGSLWFAHQRLRRVDILE